MFFLILSLHPFSSYAEVRFEGELQDCNSNIEQAKKDTTARIQLSQFFCKEDLIAEPVDEWKCEGFSPRPILCEKSYFVRCRRTYRCIKENASYNRTLIQQSYR